VLPSASAHVDRLIRVCRSGWRSSSERATALCKKGRTPRASTAISLNGKLRGILKDVKEIGVDEWSVGSYHRELDLPLGVDAERANVTYENGVLVVMSHLDQEHLRTVLLDTKNRIQAISTVYIGSLNASMVRAGEVFKTAVKLNSAALIVVHNHPSGDATPSPEDVLVTREIVQAGKLLDVDVLDHLVIGQGVWVSLRERGLGFDMR
jgi:hypothetical protein